MMTASVSATTWGSSSSNNSNNNKRRPSVAATAAAVDVYAQSILESHSTPGHEPDDSLGSYVTSLIRHGNTDDTKTVVISVRELPEFDSLVELIQEHCSISPEQAESVLEQIAKVVRTGEIPSSNNTSGTTTTIQPQRQQHHCTTEDLIQSMNLLSTGAEAESSINTNKNFMEDDEHQKHQLGTSSTTSAATRTPDSDRGDDDHDEHDEHGAGITGPPSLTMEVSTGASSSIGANSIASPIHADNLIPIDLLGVLDDPSTPKAGGGGRMLKNLSLSAASVQLMPVLSPPPPPPPTKSSSQKKKLTSQEERQRLANDIAASLFQPTTTTRSRQSSIDETKFQSASSSSNTTTTTTAAASPNNLSPNLSPNLHAVTPGAGGAGGGGSHYHDANTGSMYYHHQHEQQQQHEWNNVMDMLLTMNPEISEEAASAAAYMSSSSIIMAQHHHHQQYQQQYDVNVAQYLIDCAMSAPPVCRHLLNDGCYRSDCTYSHDIDGHVCIFWLRGRCGKGDTCRFLHGFDEKLLNDIDPSLLLEHSHDETTMNDMTYGENTYDHQESSIYEDAGYGLPPPAAAVAAASLYPPASSAWRSEAPGPRTTTTTTSFANIASQGYQTAASFASSPACTTPAANTSTTAATTMTSSSTRKVDIPQDLWNAHENRDSSVFYIADPIERYHTTAARQHQQQQRDNVIDLHFQSTKTFGVVLETILPTKLERHLLLQQRQDYYHQKSGSGNNNTPPPPGIWIVTGTGHHVGSKTHQKGGGALEQAVMEWLTEHGYDFLRGRDRNGQGGAVLVTSKRKHIL